MNLFKGIVKLSEQQYNSLKENGYLNINGTRVDFDDNTLYVTDYAEPKIEPLTQIKIVDVLPEKGYSNICYWVEKENGNGIYDQYIFINERYSYVGSTQIDLKDYLKIEDIPTTLPASDVYDWAKQPNKPNYTLDEINTSSCDLHLGDNSTIEKKAVSITRNVSNVAYQALITIYEDGSVRISRRNKNEDANSDDSYIEFSNSKFQYMGKEVLTQGNTYTKEEIDDKIQELKSLINGQ